MMYTAYIGLGSNLGDRAGNLLAGLEYLEEEGIVIEAVSSIYETEPQGFTEQPRFLNMAAKVRTTLTPRELLKLLQSIEARLGRVREVRWGPRTIDLDILLYKLSGVGDVSSPVVISEPDLKVPHPRLKERAFVLIPLLEIDEDISLPDGTLLKGCLPEAARDQEVRLFGICED